MANLFKQFKQILPDAPVLMGEVVGKDGDLLTVELLGGGLLGGGLVRARGEGDVGDRLFVRDGAVEGKAPALPMVEIEV